MEWCEALTNKTRIQEKVQAVPLDDILMVSTFLLSINKNILTSHEKTGKYLTIHEIKLTVPECGSVFVLTQDTSTGMVRVAEVLKSEK